MEIPRVVDTQPLLTRIASLEATCAQLRMALDESRQRERMLIDFAPEAIVMLDVDTMQFVDANVNAERLFGYPREKLVHLGPLDVSPARQPMGDSRGLAQEVIHDAVRGGNPVFEWWHQNAQGDRFPCEVRLVKMPWGTRDVVRGSITNISGRKQMELIERGRLEVLEQIARGVSLAEALQTLVRTVERLLPGMLCSILVLDPKTNCLRLGAAPSLPDYYNAAVDGIEVGPAVGSCGAAAYTRQRVVATDLSTHPNWAPYRELTARANLGACWSEPILALGGTLLGTFAMYYREPRKPVAVELQAISIAAQLAAIAIEHDQMQRALQRVNEDLELRVEEKTRELRHADEELKAAEGDLRLAAVAFETHDSMLITDAQGVILRVNQGFTQLTGYTAEEAIGKTPRILKSGRHDHLFYDRMWSAIRETGQWAGDVWNRRKNGEVYAQRLTITSVKNSAGHITHYVSGGHDITAEKRAEADRLAISMARRVQQCFFPSAVPQLPAFDIAGAVHPAERVSGDYYDFVSVTPSSAGVVVADVSGHGLGPALLMAQTQAYLRAMSETHDDPGDLLTHANRLFALSQSGHFVTLFLGFLDATRRSFVYASAGHQGYLVGAHGNVRILESTSIPLGVETGTTVPSSSPIYLQPGDTIVLPTDGIEEAKNYDEQLFGQQRALEVILANRHRSAAEIVNALYRAARTFAGGRPQRDDITAVVVKAQFAAADRDHEPAGGQ